tara:strand:- start:5708 stop:6775 length:1068 start_codon:yes stop_codon:yes gene_type:complete
MLQAFNPNKNIMSGKTNPFTFQQLKWKDPKDFLVVSEKIYPAYKNKQGGGKGATFRICYKDAEGNNTGKPFEIQTPPVNLSWPDVKGSHQGGKPGWADDSWTPPKIEDSKRSVKFQVGEFFSKVKDKLTEHGVKVDKLLDLHEQWYEWKTKCLDECANQIHAMVTSKEYRARMKEENVSEGVVHDLLKDVKMKTSVDSFKDNFKSGLEWKSKVDKQGINTGRVIETWCKVQKTKKRPSLQYPMITKKLINEDFTVPKNVTPSDELLEKVYRWDTENKVYHYHGNDKTEDNKPLEPEIVKHNQVAVLVYEPQFYAAPFRGFKMVLKRIQVVQDAPTSLKRKREDDVIEDEWGDCMM